MRFEWLRLRENCQDLEDSKGWPADGKVEVKDYTESHILVKQLYLLTDYNINMLNY
jgi:hypothetical protein